MTELDKTKSEVLALLRRLCARCQAGTKHVCPVQQVAREIDALRGIPVIVNDRLWHVVFN